MNQKHYGKNLEERAQKELEIHEKREHIVRMLKRQNFRLKDGSQQYLAVDKELCEYFDMITEYKDEYGTKVVPRAYNGERAIEPGQWRF